MEMASKKSKGFLEMKICFIIEAWKPFYAGGQVHAWELCKRLIEDYHCSIDIYTRKLIFEGKKYTREESLFNGKLKIIRKGRLSKLDSVFGRLSWVFSVFLTCLFKRYHIIHGQANLGGLPTWMIGLFKKTPTIFTVHGSGLLVWGEMKEGIFSKINMYLEDLLQTKLKYNREISVDSRFCKFRNKNKPIVIPNGVDVEKFDKVLIKKENKFFKILFVGRLHPQKGLKYLIMAINSIKNELNNVEFHIIGSGEQSKELQTEVNKLGLNHFIKFRGKIFGKELIKEFKSSHLFILPSIFEGQPLTLLEAWASELPVLVTDVGDNYRFVKKDLNGWILPPKDTGGLAKLILKVKDMKKNELKKIGKYGHELVKKKYSWDVMVKRTYGVYLDELKE